MKIVINTCTNGWFGLSREAFLKLRQMGSKSVLSDYDFGENNSYCSNIDRTDPLLIQIIEELGIEKCNGSRALLKIVEIPDDIQYQIEDYYKGCERVAEKHQIWS